LAQLLQAAIVVIANVSQGLAQLCGYLVEGVTLVKMQGKSMALIFGEDRKQSVDGRLSDHIAPAGQLFPAVIVVWNLRGSLQDRLCIETPGFEIATTIDGTLIGKLNEPRTKGGFSRIKDRSFMVKLQENFL